MKLSTRIITAVLLVAGSSGVVYAFSKHDDWGMSREEKIEFVNDRVTDKLDLDGAQQQKFNELAQLFMATMDEVKPSREQRMEEFSALLREPGFDQARALELVQQRTRLIDERAPALIASLAGFLDSLNTQQKDQLQEFMQHRLGHHRHGDQRSAN